MPLGIPHFLYLFYHLYKNGLRAIYLNSADSKPMPLVKS